MWVFLLILGITIAIILIVAIISVTKKENGDYKDGGGSQLGGNERVPFFAPQNERAGLIGENIINNHLRLLLRNDEYLLTNVLLPVNGDFKTEIECIIVSRKGIFCIEIKNWVGHLFGNDEDEYWIQKYDDPHMTDRNHRNPVLQNLNHSKALNRKLNNKYMIDNVVILTGYDDIENVHSKYVFSLFGFKHFYRNCSEQELTENDLKIIFDKLSPFVSTKEELEKHKEEIKKRFE